jgi:hypothetical protein
MKDVTTTTTPRALRFAAVLAVSIEGCSPAVSESSQEPPMPAVTAGATSPEPAPPSPQPAPDELTQAAVVRVIRARHSDFRACYEDALRTRPEIRGRMSVEIMIQPDGTVGSARAVELSSSPSLDECVLEIFRRMRWARGRATETAFTYPLIFAPQEAPAPGPAWTELTVDRLTVSMPAPPVRRERAVTDGQRHTTLLEHTSTYGDAAFMLMRSELDPQLRTRPPEQIYPRLSTPAGRVVSSSTIRVGPHIGRAMEVELPDSTIVVRLRMFAIDGTLYQLIASTPRTNPMPEVTGRFFSSLRVAD